MAETMVIGVAVKFNNKMEPNISKSIGLLNRMEKSFKRTEALLLKMQEKKADFAKETAACMEKMGAFRSEEFFGIQGTLGIYGSKTAGKGSGLKAEEAGKTLRDVTDSLVPTLMIMQLALATVQSLSLLSRVRRIRQ